MDKNKLPQWVPSVKYLLHAVPAVPETAQVRAVKVPGLVLLCRAAREPAEAEGTGGGWSRFMDGWGSSLQGSSCWLSRSALRVRPCRSCSVAELLMIAAAVKCRPVPRLLSVRASFCDLPVFLLPATGSF